MKAILKTVRDFISAGTNLYKETHNFCFQCVCSSQIAITEFKLQRQQLGIQRCSVNDVTLHAAQTKPYIE